jgi:hypothetical protein
MQDEPWGLDFGPKLLLLKIMFLIKLHLIISLKEYLLLQLLLTKTNYNMLKTLILLLSLKEEL